MDKQTKKTREIERTLTVAEMFPETKLKKHRATETVRNMTPRDFQAMQRAFSVPPRQVRNKKVQSLTTRDLKSIEGLFGDYRSQVIAGFEGVGEFQKDVLAASGDSCCCCCTPCCCCSCAAVQDGPSAAV